MGITAADIAKALGGKKQGTGWTARCPAHNDKSPSLSIGIGDDKPVVLKCHTGCTQDAVIDALKARDLWPDGTEDSVEVRDVGFLPKAWWVYHDAEGQPVLKVTRAENGHGKKTFFQEHIADGAWVRGGADREFAPLNYAAYRDHHNVFLVEGEKCADALKALGLEATATPGGASGWKSSFAKYFKGHGVCILPDNDGPGKRYAEAALHDILAAGAANAFIVELPGLDEKEDIVDWLGKRPKSETPAESAKALVALAKASKPKSPIESCGFRTFSHGWDAIESIQDENAVTRISFGMPFLDDATGGIMKTDLIVMTARSGSGKTQLAMNTAKHAVLSGKRVAFFALEAYDPEMEMRMAYNLAVTKFLRDPNRRRDVWVSWSEWVSGDEAVRMALRPYFEQAREENRDRYKNLFVYYRDSKGFNIKNFEEKFAVASKEVDLVIVDHLNYFDTHEGKFRNENQVTSDIMKRMRDAVLIHRIPVMLIVHIRKSDFSDKRVMPDMDDLHGSSDIYKVATKVLILGAAKGEDVGPAKQPTYVRIAKNRYGDSLAQYCALINYDISRGTYESEYQLGRLMVNDTKWVQVTDGNKPKWFGRNRRLTEGRELDLL